MKIPITKPFMNDEEFNEIKECLENGWLVQGPKVKKFEEEFCLFSGIKYAKAVSSCTTALHVGLLTLGMKSGYDVIVPSFTYIATANSIEYTGATPVFCDIDIKTYNLDPKKIREIIEEEYSKNIDGKLINKTTGNELKAILTVHQFGLASNIPEINEIARKYNLKVFEDGACGIGARIKDVHVGNFGNMCAFSFHPRKSVTTGEGGIVSTNDENESKNIEALRSHGATISDLQRHNTAGFLLPEFNILGYNYRMTDIQGGIGYQQMKKLQMFLDQKQIIVSKYLKELKKIDFIEPPFTPENYYHGYQSFVLRVNHEKLGMNVEEANIRRNDFMMKLEEEGISTRQGTHAIHTLGYYKNKYNLNNDKLYNSYIADRLSMAFPLYYSMKDEELDYVIKNIYKYIGIFTE